MVCRHRLVRQLLVLAALDLLRAAEATVVVLRFPSSAAISPGETLRSLLGRHCNHLALRLGPGVLAEDFAFGPLAPHNRALWKRDFVRLFDGVARKTLLDAAPGPGGKPRWLFVKGHFLCAADFLARRYPDATFLTMICEPAPRKRHGYSCDRSLAEVGIGEAALNERLADYIAWCRGAD